MDTRNYVVLCMIALSVHDRPPLPPTYYCTSPATSYRLYPASAGNYTPYFDGSQVVYRPG
jgi:hypothetical protein